MPGLASIDRAGINVDVTQRPALTPKLPVEAPISGRRRTAAGDPVRERIKAAAIDLFTRRGFHGVTFIDIGRSLGIPHSLVHYHFGSKPALAEEVLRDFSDKGMTELANIWENPDTSLLEKFTGGRNRLYQRFLQFNPDGIIAHAPGLVSRFSMEFETITPEMQRLVKQTHERTDRIILNALTIALDRNELRKDCPKHLLMLQIGSAFFVPGPIAHYGWSFERLDDLLRSIYVTIMGAFGESGADPSPWPSLYRRSGKATRKSRPRAKTAAASD